MSYNMKAAILWALLAAYVESAPLEDKSLIQDIFSGGPSSGLGASKWRHQVPPPQTPAHHAHGSSDVIIMGHGGHSGSAVNATTVSSPPLNVHVPGRNITINNQSVPLILQQLLAGNVVDVEDSGKPFTTGIRKNGVAVIYSSALHIVQLGDLASQAPPAPPAVVPVAVKEQHSQSQLPLLLNQTLPFSLNTTGFLDSLFQPLMSFTHLGASAPQQVQVQQTPIQAPIPVQAVPVMAQAPAMQVQPVVLMMAPTANMPVSQFQHQLPNMQILQIPSNQAAQFDGFLQNLISKKNEVLTSAMAAPSPLDALSVPVVPAHDHAHSGLAHHAASSGVMAQPHVHPHVTTIPTGHPVKRVDINISKVTGRSGDMRQLSPAIVENATSSWTSETPTKGTHPANTTISVPSQTSTPVNITAPANPSGVAPGNVSATFGSSVTAPATSNTTTSGNITAPANSTAPVPVPVNPVAPVGVNSTAPVV